MFIRSHFSEKIGFFAVILAVFGSFAPGLRAAPKTYYTVDPPTGDAKELTWDPYTVRNGKFLSAYDTLRTYITFTPKPKTCLIVQRDPDEADFHLCKKLTIAVRPIDVARDGSIHWKIWINDDPDYKELVWRTQIRFGDWLELMPKEPYVLSPLVLRSCILSKTAKGQHVELMFVPETVWTLDVKNTLELLPQPEPKPNLFIMSDTMRKSGGVSSESEVAHDIAKDDPSKKSWVSWKLSDRDTYELSPDALTLGDRMPNKIKGRCRLRKAAKASGDALFECQNTHGIAYFSSTIPCLK